MSPVGPNGGTRAGAGRLLPVLLPLLVTTPVSPAVDPTIAIVDVRLLPMDGSAARDGQAVLVVGDRISWVGPTGSLPAPPGTVVVRGSGRTLMPGLVDMHVHLRRDDLDAYLAHGVTTVRNMWGYPDVWEMKREVESGATAGPTIHTVSPGLDGTPPKWPLTQLVMDPATADSVVEAQYRAGYRTLKVYQDLRPAAYDSIVAAADRRGMDFVGHVPHRVGLERALAAGQRSIEHLTGHVGVLAAGGGRGPIAWSVIREERLPAVVTATREAGVWICPTLAIVSRLGRGIPGERREAFRANRRRVVKALHDGGARLLVGTDSGIDVVDPGASMLDELKEFEAAGIPTADVLRIATAGAAEFLHGEGEFGVVAAGARADLLLLDGDPTRDLEALATPAGVMARGRWFLEPRTASRRARPAVTPREAAPPARASAAGATPGR